LYSDVSWEGTSGPPASLVQAANKMRATVSLPGLKTPISLKSRVAYRVVTLEYLCNLTRQENRLLQAYIHLPYTRSHIQGIVCEYYIHPLITHSTALCSEGSYVAVETRGGHGP
jgi:hypothetical protein